MEIITVALQILALIISNAPDVSSSDGPWEGMTEELAVKGCAAYYREGLMEEVATYWGYIDNPGQYDEWLKDSGYAGAIAGYRAGDKGREAYVVWPDGSIEGPYLIIESVAEAHFELGMRRSRVIDVDYSSKVKHNIRGPMNVVLVYNTGALESFLSMVNEQVLSMAVTDRYEGCLKR